MDAPLARGDAGLHRSRRRARKEGRNRSLTVENLEASQAAIRERQERDVAAAAEPASQAPTRGPLASVFLEDWRNLLRIVGLRFAEALPYFLLTVFVLSYGPQHLGIEKESLNTAILIMAVLAFPAHGIFSWISDKIGRRPVYFFGALVVFVMAFLFFGLLNTGSFVLIVLGYVLMLNLAQRHQLHPAGLLRRALPGGPPLLRRGHRARDRVDRRGRPDAVHRDRARGRGRVALAARRAVRHGRRAHHDAHRVEDAGDLPP